LRYVVVYEQTQNNWSAYGPDLPGCVAVAIRERK
jgi:predicted RNase H-like HicB family nuclease